MSDFLKKFLLEDVRRLAGASSRGVFLGAFGKHPGWDDHVEDLGLETESLIYAKTLLYVQGIGSQIDSGGWEKLEPGQHVPEFKHLFVWMRGAQLLAGRMWASSDGKGRTRYPMIVCAHCAGVTLDWVLDEVLPRLEAIERSCRATGSAEDVRQLLNRHRTELRQAISSIGTATAPSRSPDRLTSQFLSDPGMGPDQERWARLLYQMESQLSAYAPGRFTLKGDLSGFRPQQLRVPSCERPVSETLQFWPGFFHQQIDPIVPLLLLVPLDEQWIDVTVGEPTAHEFFCLRASPRKVPLVTEVPYSLDPEFRQRAKTFLQQIQTAGAGSKDLKDRSGTTTFVAKSASTPNKSKWFKWLVGGASVVCIVGLVWAVVTIAGRDGPAKSATAPAGSRPDPASAAASSASEPEPSHPLVNSAPLESTGIPVVPAGFVEPGNGIEAPVEAVLNLAKAEPSIDERALREREEEEKSAAIEAARRQEEQEAQAKALARVKEAAAQAEALEGVGPEAVAKVGEAAPLGVEEKAVPNAPPPTVAPENPAGAVAVRWMTNLLGLELVWVPEDTWVGKYEVTQEQFQKLMGKNPSKFTNSPNLPVDSVDWSEAMEFCRRLTEREKGAGTLPGGAVYTLPTQEQWTGFLADASFEQSVTSREKRRLSTAEVGASPSNRRGLHDLLGNVWEWCLDEPAPGERVLMGGAYNTTRTYSFRPFQPTTSRNLPVENKTADVGFRCVLITRR